MSFLLLGKSKGLEGIVNNSQLLKETFSRLGFEELSYENGYNLETNANGCMTSEDFVKNLKNFYYEDSQEFEGYMKAIKNIKGLDSSNVNLKFLTEYYQNSGDERIIFSYLVGFYSGKDLFPTLLGSISNFYVGEGLVKSSENHSINDIYNFLENALEENGMKFMKNSPGILEKSGFYPK